MHLPTLGAYARACCSTSDYTQNRWPPLNFRQRFRKFQPTIETATLGNALSPATGKQHVDDLFHPTRSLCLGTPRLLCTCAGSAARAISERLHCPVPRWRVHESL